MRFSPQPVPVPALLAAALLLALVLPAAAHGVHTTVHHENATAITATYADGTPLAQTPWRAVPPDSDRAFARGVTDDLGRLYFRPDRIGAWKVIVETSDGHGARLTVHVDDPSLPVRSRGSRSRTWGIALALLAVVAATWLLNAWLRRSQP